MTDYDYVYIKMKGYEDGVGNVYIMKSEDVKLFVELTEILQDYYDLSGYYVQAKQFNREPLPGNQHYGWCNYRSLEWALMDAFNYLKHYDEKLFKDCVGGPLEARVYYLFKRLYEDKDFGIEFEDIQEVFDFVELLKGK